MNYVYMIKSKPLHFIFISLDEFTMQMIHVYKNIKRVQKGIQPTVYRLSCAATCSGHLLRHRTTHSTQPPLEVQQPIRLCSNLKE
jgi:hypothetical protein